MWAIASAFKSITSGLGARTFDPSRVVGTARDAEDGAVAQSDYFRWARLVQKKKLDHAMCMDIVGFGISLSDTDTNRRRTRGTAKRNLIKCLNLWGK